MYLQMYIYIYSKFIYIYICFFAIVYVCSMCAVMYACITYKGRCLTKQLQRPQRKMEKRKKTQTSDTL